MLSKLLQQVAIILAEGGGAASRHVPPSITRSSTACLRHVTTAAAYPESAGPAQLLDGKGVANAWQAEIAREVQKVTEEGGRPPGLAVVLVGDRPDSNIYVSRKQEACIKVGINSVLRQLPDTVGQAEIEAVVRELCEDATIDGILVQLPLPPHLDEESIIESFDPAKDVDGFHPLNVGRILMRGRAPTFVPCTALGCMELLMRSGVDVRGKKAVILGDSNVVGMPLSMLLRDAGVAALTACHRISYKEHQQSILAAVGPQQRAQAQACAPTLPGPQVHSEGSAPLVSQPAFSDAVQQRAHGFGLNLPDVLRQGDILIVAVGCPELVKASWVKPGAVVIDVGINVVGIASDAGSSVSPEGSEGDSGESKGGLNSGKSTEERRSKGGVAEREAGYKGPQHRVVGDVDFPGVSQIASSITPVPGGVGPMTIAALMYNTVLAARQGLTRRQSARND